MTWKIAPVEGGGWHLFHEGTTSGVWWHVYTNKWYPVFPTLDDVFTKIKEGA
jgi:hypothetical protein